MSLADSGDWIHHPILRIFPIHFGSACDDMAGALDTYPRRDLAEYFLNIPIYFQLYLK